MLKKAENRFACRDDLVPVILILWGRLVTCGGLVIRLIRNQKYIIGPITNRPQVTNPPHTIQD
jgi:hypothetical protein